MASKESTDMILELLYDELSPEESLRARTLIAQNEELQAEFNRLRATRDEIRTELNTALPAQEVPASIHDSIMAAAAAHLQSTHANPSPSSQNTSAQNPTFAPRPPRETLWSRIANTPRAQFTALATVAALLLASAVLWRQINYTEAPTSFANASHEVAQAIAFDTHDAPTPAALPLEVAAAPAPKAEANEPYEFETATQESGAALHDELLNQNEESRESKGSIGRARSASSPTIAKKAAAPRSVTRESAQASATAKASVPSPPAPASRAAAHKSELAYAPAKKSVPSSTAPAPTAVAQLSEAEDRFESYDSTAGAPSSAKKSAEKPAEKSAEPAPQPALSDDALLQEADNFLAKRQPAEAIANAEKVLKNPTAAPNSRARALHIQAKAYTLQGHYPGAHLAYRTLQTEYPDYKTKEIDQAIRKLIKENDHYYRSTPTGQ